MTSKSKFSTNNSLFSLPTNKTSLITLGNFDGVHIGHQSFLKQFLDYFDPKKHEKILLLTFWPHPQIFFGKDLKLLQTLNQRLEKLDLVIKNIVPQNPNLINFSPVINIKVLEFNQQLAELSALQFLHKLKTEYNLQTLVLGQDSSFGKDRQINLVGIQNLSSVLDFELKIIFKKPEESHISSSFLRRQLHQFVDL